MRKSFNNRVYLTKIERIILFFFVFLFKIFLEYGFLKLLVERRNYFYADFSIPKYIVAFACCLISFLCFDFKKKRASSFLMFFIYVFQIIPISVVFSLRNESILCYLMIWISFVACQLILKYVKEGKRETLKNMSIRPSLFFAAFVVAVLYLLVRIYISNGLPSLMAMQINDVYKLRASGLFSLGKYDTYLLECATTVFIPILIVSLAQNKKYLYMALMSLVLFLLYLYTGQRTYLFYIFFCIAIAFISKRENAFFDFFAIICLFFIVLSVLSLCFKNAFLDEVYSLFIRRTLVVPANLKFVHYDYFLSHPYLGFYGALPKVFVTVPAYYESVNYQNDIGLIYFNNPNNYANTGFLIECFSRFGIIGLPISVVIMSFIMSLMDKFQKRNSFSTCLGFFTCAIYSLSETQIIGNLFFGPWLFLIVVAFTYREEKKKQR